MPNTLLTARPEERSHADDALLDLLALLARHEGIHALILSSGHVDRWLLRQSVQLLLANARLPQYLTQYQLIRLTELVRQRLQANEARGR